MEADDAEVEVDRAGPQLQHPLGALEQGRDPAGAVVDPLDRQHLRRVEAEGGRDPRRLLLDRARSARSGGAAKASRSSVAPDPDQARVALLHDLVRVARLSPGLEPGVAGAERRVAGERQLQRPA